MNLSARRSIGVAVAAMAALAATAVPAAAAAPSGVVSPNIHRVSCNDNGYLQVRNNGGQSVLCFADAGFTGVAIYGVNWIESGNNRANIQFQRNLNDPKLESHTMGKWQSWNPGGSIHKVTRIEIF
ncbi:beta/gamma crystallin domain-containing protein [Streptomyces sp. NPDC057654]|uniref:beta/gamma crystallin domain-containing protein n=1 Tax=Streptomyces sp. NPDC057654 TaxID=3346196 RepID=UPI0036CF1CC7